MKKPDTLKRYMSLIGINILREEERKNHNVC